MDDSRPPKSTKEKKRTEPGVNPDVRIAELEAQLADAHKTIAVLVDKVDRRTHERDTYAELFDSEKRIEKLFSAHTRTASDNHTLASIENELHILTVRFDQVVRQRTRALAESEAQLRRKNEELKRLNKLKAEFISIAAHELRTPLTSIVGYLDLMHEGSFGELPEEMVRPAASLRRNAHRLMRLVEEMLDVSRIESGRMVLNHSLVELGQIVANVVEELAPLADSKQQQLRVEHKLSPHVVGDEDKIHQIITNLIANAIRYTPDKGVISVSVDIAPKNDTSEAWARLLVHDNGIGIPEHLRSRIFEPFSDVVPAKHHTSRVPDSAGLGLYIARGLVELHAGIISVESEEGEYTQFTVLLPLAKRHSTRAV